MPLFTTTWPYHRARQSRQANIDHRCGREAGCWFGMVAAQSGSCCLVVEVGKGTMLASLWRIVFSRRASHCRRAFARGKLRSGTRDMAAGPICSLALQMNGSQQRRFCSRLGQYGGGGGGFCKFLGLGLACPGLVTGVGWGSGGPTWRSAQALERPPWGVEAVGVPAGPGRGLLPLALGGPRVVAVVQAGGCGFPPFACVGALLVLVWRPLPPLSPCAQPPPPFLGVVIRQPSRGPLPLGEGSLARRMLPTLGGGRARGVRLPRAAFWWCRCGWRPLGGPWPG